MHSSRSHADLLDALSDRLLRHGAPETWRKVFLGTACGAIRFEHQVLTLLWTDTPADFSAGELVVLAARFDGRSERLDGNAVMFSFEEPLHALRAAMVLQKLATTQRIRCSLSTEACHIARFEVDGQERCVVLPPDLEQTRSEGTRAAPGAIAISPETYAALEAHIGELRDGLLATEMEDETVTGASITLAPAHADALSTFAGLGLT